MPTQHHEVDRSAATRASSASRASWEMVLPSRSAIWAALSRTRGSTRKAMRGETAARPVREGRPPRRRTSSTMSAAFCSVSRVPSVSRTSSRSRSTSGPIGVLEVMGGGVRSVRAVSSDAGRHDVDDQQVVLAAVGRLHLDGDDLQFSASFVEAYVEPGVGPAGGGDRRRSGAGQDVAGGGPADAVLARRLGEPDLQGISIVRHNSARQGRPTPS